MNIFCIYKDAAKAAKHLVDSHCNKQLLESAQMIANCFSHSVLAKAPKTKKGLPRKYSYEKHPCSIWTRKNKSNLKWLIDHAVAMEKERLSRGYNPHFSAEFINWAQKNIHKSFVSEGELEDFSIAISEDSKCRTVSNFDKLNSVAKYRLYYKMDKSHLAKWRKNKPSWYDFSVSDILQIPS